MLYTRIYKSRMTIMIKQLMLKCTSCVACCAHELHSGRPALNLRSVVQELTEEMAERIFATIGQENIIKSGKRNIVKL